MSLKCPVSYASQLASQPGKSLPYGLGLGNNIKMSSNKYICVFCTIWPSDTSVVDLSCLSRVSLLSRKDCCVGHNSERVCSVYCTGHQVTMSARGSQVFTLKLWGQTSWACPYSWEPLSSASISVSSLPAGGDERNAARAITQPLNLYPPSVFSNWQMVDPNICDSET